jgi:hypothetical protein
MVKNMSLEPLKIKELPPAWPLKKLIGPSFIILGVGLGSGELILWPYLVSNFGLGLIWAAIVGITFQFFINMEIERYTLVTGESVFVGLTRKFGRWIPLWFIVTTLLPWIWPGIMASAATLVAAIFGIAYSKWIGISMLVGLGVIYSLGSVVYRTQEKVQKGIILLGVPFILVLTLVLAVPSDWQALASGLIGKGHGFNWLPLGLPLATFLGALAYAGAGGNLNLAQSLYAKEKGYGMGRYSGRITNILAGNPEEVELEGSTFEINSGNLERFNTWWRRINIEHGIVFWLTGAATMLLLSLLAYATVYGHPEAGTSINFVLLQGAAIGQRLLPGIGLVFLVAAAVMLFGTQFSVYGSNGRMAAENLAIADKKRFPIHQAPKYFYFFLWLQIILGIIIFAVGFTEPLALVVTGAVLNAFSMFVYSGLVLWLNLTALQKPLRPSVVRIVMVGAACLFYGSFTGFTIWRYLIG